MKKNYETVIIGAGPGGLTAGRFLEDAVILDQKKEIGIPVQCAEGLAEKFLKLLKISPQNDWIATKIQNCELFFPNKESIILREEGLYILNREKFEKFLSSFCKAEILLQKRVAEIRKKADFWEIETSNGEIFKSRYLIGADGVFSIVRRKIFKEPVRYLPCASYLTRFEKKVPLDTLKMYFHPEKFPLGYAWLFPKEENLANIGLGCFHSCLDIVFKEFLEEMKEEIGNYQFLKSRGGIVPFMEEPMEVFRENAFLVGDAGGMVNPITAGGIGNAMLSGKMAAEAILSKKPEIYSEKVKTLDCFQKELFSIREILFSFDANTFNELGEVLKGLKRDVFQFLKEASFSEKISLFLKFFKKHHLRENILSFLKLYFTYKSYKKAGF